MSKNSSRSLLSDSTIDTLGLVTRGLVTTSSIESVVFAEVGDEAGADDETPPAAVAPPAPVAEEDAPGWCRWWSFFASSSRFSWARTRNDCSSSSHFARVSISCDLSNFI